MDLKKILILIMVCVTGNLYSSEMEDEFLKVKNQDLTWQAYQVSLSVLEEDLPKLIRESKDIREIKTNSEFWISYFNSLMYIRGYTLKKEAELEKLSGKGVVAQKRYARFLKEAQLSD